MSDEAKIGSVIRIRLYPDKSLSQCIWGTDSSDETDQSPKPIPATGQDCPPGYRYDVYSASFVPIGISMREITEYSLSETQPIEQVYTKIESEEERNERMMKAVREFSSG